MRLNRYWIYPRVRNLGRIVPYVFLGAIFGGLYGAVHDQISYTISPEYFTRFKFYQFQYADFGLPLRGFVGIIGFLAVCWMGAIAGWLLARIRFNSDDLTTARGDVLVGLVIVLGTAILFGSVGGLIGYIRAYHFPLNAFMGWEAELSGAVLQRFAVVGFLHNSEYLGGLVGLVIAVIKMKRGLSGNFT